MTEASHAAPDTEEFPFRGSIVWLTPAATAYVPPHTAATGLASFVLRDFQPGAWRSQAQGRWLVVGNEGDQAAQQGSVVVITEGARDVAFFIIEQKTRR